MTGLPAQAAAVADSGLAGALQVANQLGAQGAALADTAKEAFLSGFALATTIGGIAAAVASVVVWRLLPALRYAAAPEPAPAVVEGPRLLDDGPAPEPAAGLVSPSSTGYEGYETLRFERHGDVLQVTIDNPRSAMNVVDDTLHAELARVRVS